MNGSCDSNDQARIQTTRDLSRILTISILIQTFFLFTANYAFPGGSQDFFVYADALLHGQKARISNVASRDVGYPLLVILSGYFSTNSLVGLTIIQALMGISIPILIYLSIAPLSRAIAYYTAIASIISLSPYFFVKWIHHDQAYVFFCILSIWAFCRFVNSKRPADLYLFTLVIIATSLTRPIGNLLFPVLLPISYVAARGRIRHYVGALLLFIAAMGAYQLHRYIILDVANRTDIPSYTGQQLFYNLYMNSKEHGILLSEDLGPNMRQITEKVYASLLPAPTTSQALKVLMNSEAPPSDFLEKVTVPFLNKYFYPYTAEEFRTQLYREPNWEYFLLMSLVETNDQIYLGASWEIIKAYPFHPVKYTLRNLWLFLYEPGYFHTRFNPIPIFRGGQFFPFDGQSGIGGAIFGAGAATLGLPPRAAREVGFDSFASQPDWAKQLYGVIKSSWLAAYDSVVRVLLVLIFISWIYVLFFSVVVFSTTDAAARRCAFLVGKDLIVPICGISAIFLYNSVLTAAFGEPDYRYHHMILSIKIVLAGFGAVALGRIVHTLAPLRLYPARSHALILLIITLGLGACFLWARYVFKHTA